MAISISPSGEWLGNDGPWSTFELQIGLGRHAQNISVLPATSKSNVWAVTPEYCRYVPYELNCTKFRGGFFKSNESTSWSRIRLNYSTEYFNLPFASEASLGYVGNGELGEDTVVLRLPGKGSEILEDQAIAAFAGTVPWLATGLLGLSSETLNVSNRKDNHSSPLSALQETKRIPSKFWGYNAGARYQKPKVPASLTFGGYDAGRGGELKDALQVHMQEDIVRNFVVSVPSISFGYGGSTELYPQVNAYIDSVVPDLWLPESICQGFEKEFGLEWNETAGMYLLDDAHRTQLSDTDANVTFALADPRDPSKTKEISVTYAALDLEAMYPLAGILDDSVLHYFPLKRANDSTGYYLGHAFLQGAYLSADYHRHEFYLSQANLVYEPVPTKLRTVLPPGHKSLGTGAVVGIAIGAVCLVLLGLGIAAWFLCRPRWRKRRNSRFRARIEAQNMGLPNTQLPTAQETEMREYYAKRPLSPDSDFKQELDATTTARGSITTRAEMDSPSQSAGGSPRGKMSPRRSSYGFPTSPAELESRSPRMMHSRTASGSSIEPMSPLSGHTRTELGPTEEVYELP